MIKPFPGPKDWAFEEAKNLRARRVAYLEALFRMQGKDPLVDRETLRIIAANYRSSASIRSPEGIFLKWRFGRGEDKEYDTGSAVVAERLVWYYMKEILEENGYSIADILRKAMEAPDRLEAMGAAKEYLEAIKVLLRLAGQDPDAAPQRRWSEGRASARAALPPYSPPAALSTPEDVDFEDIEGDDFDEGFDEGFDDIEGDEP